ncbi:MAG: tetratricopeptide repeat protein [Saprospiraceae bacterium]
MKNWIYHFFNELKRRNVLKTASIYLVSSWGIIQVAATIFPQLGFPEWAVKAVIIILILGFPLALFISWFYEIVPDQGQSQESALPRKNLGRWKWMLIIGLGLIITFGVVFTQVGISKSSPTQKQPTFELEGLTAVPEFPEAISSPIVVLPFTYHNESKSGSNLGTMYADWISQKLLNFPEIKIVPNVQLHTQIDLENLPSEIEYLIHGNIYELEDTFRVVSSIINVGKNEAYVFPTVKASTESQLDAADQTAEMIAGYWGFREEVDQKKITPPKFEAYQLWMEALNSTEASEKVIRLLKEIAQIDPDFNLAKIVLMEIEPNENWKDQLEEKFSDLTAYEKAVFEMQDLDLVNKMVYALAGQTNKAEEIIRKIEAKPYDDPKWDIYNVGRILALLGRDQEAFVKFKEAFSKQMPFSELVYNFDPYLLRYWDYEPFWNWATPRY